MSTRRHPSVIPGPADSNEAPSAPRLPRDIVLAAIVVTILLAGVGVGGAFSPQPGMFEPEPQGVDVPQQAEFVYFPDQHVNQGKETSEQIQAF